MTTPLVWDHPLSPYVQKVKIALREKGVAFETAMPGGIEIGGAAGEFVAANPRAKVPALVDGEARVFDSTIILEYIEDRWPAPALLPVDAAGRAKARIIEELLDTHLEAINWGLSELTWFKRAEGERAAAIRATAGEQIAGCHAWLEGELGDAEWFGGDRFGWADLSVAPYLNGSAAHGFPPEEGSRLVAWLARANARESVAATNAEAAEIAKQSGMADVADLLERGLFKREYRDHRLEWMVKVGGLDIVEAGLAKGNIRFSPDWH